MALETLLQQGGSPLVMIAVASSLGILHALEPGHAKTLMAAFIVAVRGTAWQAVVLGLSVALSHTLIVWLLALIGLTWGEALLTETLRPWFDLAAGSIILLVGLGTLARALPARSRSGQGDEDSPPAEDAHALLHADQLRDRFRDGRASTRQVALFGVAGGLIPCSAAVTVLVICLQQREPLLGAGLVGAFTLGLALMLVMVGLLAASGTRAAGRSRPLTALMRWAPCASGIVVAVIGLGMIDDALARFGL